MKIGRLLRATRKARATRTLAQRPDDALSFLSDMPEAGEALMLDAGVYIDQLKGRLPPAVEARVLSRGVYHSSLVLAELSFPFGRLDPADPRTRAACGALGALLAAIPDRRIFTPPADALMRGAILAGVLARTLGYDEARRRKGLVDATIAAHATAENLMLVTRNLADFDRLAQLLPRLKVAFYRT